MNTMTETQNTPLITVVTVVYNDVAHIERTMLSVLNQTYPNIEYIIIDGGSTDGTVDVIKKYAERLAYWVSEPDKGIYDAMNKGIDKATGDWINFMNCGDRFYDKNIVAELFQLNNYSSTINVIYGNTALEHNGKQYLHLAAIKNGMRESKGFSHQSVFVKTIVHKKYLFDTLLYISADYYLFYKLYNENPEQFIKYNGIIAIFNNNGISNNSGIVGYIENSVVNRRYRSKNFVSALIKKYLYSWLRLNIINKYFPIISDYKLKKRCKRIK